MKKYIKEALMLLKSDENPDKKVFNSCKKAENHLTQVIAKLKSEIVDAEIDLEEKIDKYKKAKYSIKWLDNPINALSDIDTLKQQVEDAEERVDNLYHTIELREELLAEYQEEIEEL